MKKIMFLFSFVLLAGMMSAQTKACDKKGDKKCCAKKAGQSTTMTAVGSPAGDMTFIYAEADKLAETDENIEKRVCDKSGSVSYYQKSVDADSQKESWTEVAYNTESKSFEHVALEGENDMAAPAPGTPGKKACSKKCDAKCAKSCCAKKSTMEKDADKAAPAPASEGNSEGI